MVRILPNFGVGEAYCSINYTPEQDTILRTTTPHIRYKHNIKTLRRDPSFSFATYDDESTVALSFETTTAIMNNKSNNFKGWECGIGLESLFVNYDGNVQRGNCGVGGIIGNIANDIDWPNESVTCNKSECHCVADLLISKRIQ
jgi:hypothetical protein